MHTLVGKLNGSCILYAHIWDGSNVKHWQFPKSSLLFETINAYERAACFDDELVLLTCRKDKLMIYTGFIPCDGNSYVSLSIVVNGIALTDWKEVTNFFKESAIPKLIDAEIIIPQKDNGFKLGDSSQALSFENILDEYFEEVDACAQEFRKTSFSYALLPPIDPSFYHIPDECEQLGYYPDNRRFYEKSVVYTCTFSSFNIPFISEDDKLKKDGGKSQCNIDSEANNEKELTPGFTAWLLAIPLIVILVVFIIDKGCSSDDETDYHDSTIVEACMKAGVGTSALKSASFDNSDSSASVQAEAPAQEAAPRKQAETRTQSVPSGPTYLSVSENRITFPATGGRKSISVSCDGSWSTGTPADSRVTLTRTSSGYTISAGPNYSSSSFNDYFTVVAGGLSRRVDIFQAPGGCTRLSASPGTVKLTRLSDYEYIDVSHDGIDEVSASSGAGWINLSFVSDTRLKISCTRNDSQRRSGTITISCGNKSVTITVKQNGTKDCPSCHGHGKRSCTNDGFWSNQFGFYQYGYVNGRHVLRRIYQYPDPWTGFPQVTYEDQDCNLCGGTGEIECKRCDGYKVVDDNW